MKKVTAEIIEKNRFLVTVEVEDDATEDDIYNAIEEAYMEDDYRVIEQYVYDITNIKVCVKNDRLQKIIRSLTDHSRRVSKTLSLRKLPVC